MLIFAKKLFLDHVNFFSYQGVHGWVLKTMEHSILFLTPSLIDFKSSDENFCVARLCCIDCRNSSKSDGTISVQEMVSKMELDHHQKVELLRKLEKKEKRGFKKIRKSKKDSPKEQTLLKKLNVDSAESPCNKVITQYLNVLNFYILFYVLQDLQCIMSPVLRKKRIEELTEKIILQNNYYLKNLSLQRR